MCQTEKYIAPRRGGGPILWRRSSRTTLDRFRPIGSSFTRRENGGHLLCWWPVAYAQQTKELINMTPKYLNRGGAPSFTARIWRTTWMRRCRRSCSGTRTSSKIIGCWHSTSSSDKLEGRRGPYPDVSRILKAPSISHAEDGDHQCAQSGRSMLYFCRPFGTSFSDTYKASISTFTLHASLSAIWTR